MSDYNFEPHHSDMGDHIASGIVNSGLFQIVKVLCQFGSVIVLSRLLPPADFGIIAMVSPVYGFVALFQDFGLSQATIQKHSIRHDEVNVFFWINIGVGAALTALVVALSPLIGWYYGEPRVVPLTAAMGLLIFAGVTGNQHSAILTRRMEFSVLTLIGTIGSVAGLVVSIVAALIVKNYWALYYGTVAGVLLPAIGVWIASGWRPTLPRRVRGLGHMLRFGAGLTIANMANFFAANTDNVLIGHRWGDHALGLYDRAYKLLLFPLQKIVGPVMGTMVPVLSRLTHDPVRYRNTYLKALGQTALIAWPGIVWAIVLADTLVPTLLGKQWTDSSAIFVPLAIASLSQVVSWSTGCLFISQRRAKELAWWAIANGVTSVAAFLIGLPYGPIGVATGYAVREYLCVPVFWWSLTRRGPVGLRDLMFAIAPQAASALAAALVLFGYRRWVDAPPILFIGGGLVLAYATAALTMSLSSGGRETLGHSLKAAQRILGHMVGKKNRN